jgi:hypothetical protein
MKIVKASINLSVVGLVLILGYLFVSKFTDVGARESIQSVFQNPRSASSEPTLTPQKVADELVLPVYDETNPVSGSIQRLVVMNTTIPNRPRVDVTTYEVLDGDNLFAIGEKYGLKPETVLWGNYDILRDNPQFLKTGQVLTILPTDGVYYQWNGGDQLSSIADFFKVEKQSILEWPGNEFDIYGVDSENPSIETGTWLIIPGGRRALKDWGPPAITRSNPAAAQYYGSGYCGQIYQGAIGTGAFIWPTPATYISGYDYNPSIHPGLDIGGAEGNAVYAADSGVVVYSGWSEYGYGYLIVLDHGNGWQTAYAHLSGVGVTCGQSTARGTMIGAVGNTGNSSGSHLHFEMRSEIYGKVNPWDFVSP